MQEVFVRAALARPCLSCNLGKTGFKIFQTLHNAQCPQLQWTQCTQWSMHNDLGGKLQPWGKPVPRTVERTEVWGREDPPITAHSSYNLCSECRLFLNIASRQIWFWNSEMNTYLNEMMEGERDDGANGEFGRNINLWQRKIRNENSFQEESTRWQCQPSCGRRNPLMPGQI